MLGRQVRIRVDSDDRFGNDIDLFYKWAILDAQEMGPGQFFGPVLNEECAGQPSSSALGR